MGDRQTEGPSIDEVKWVLKEMDRHGPNRGWVLCAALWRAVEGTPIAPPEALERMRREAGR
jgi:hypothetical protein